MSAITAATIKYSEPFVTKIGGTLFTATNIEVPATTEEYLEGGIELKPESLGLTVGFVSLGTGQGATASGFPGAVWTSGFMQTVKTTYEAGKQVIVAYACGVVLQSGVPWLRIYSQETAGIGKLQLEAKTETKVKLSGLGTTIFAIGK